MDTVTSPKKYKWRALLYPTRVSLSPFWSFRRIYKPREHFYYRSLPSRLLTGEVHTCSMALTMSSELVGNAANMMWPGLQGRLIDRDCGKGGGGCREVLKESKINTKIFSRLIKVKKPLNLRTTRKTVLEKGNKGRRKCEKRSVRGASCI